MGWSLSALVKASAQSGVMTVSSSERLREAPISEVKSRAERPLLALSGHSVGPAGRELLTQGGHSYESRRTLCASINVAGRVAVNEFEFQANLAKLGCFCPKRFRSASWSTGFCRTGAFAYFDDKASVPYPVMNAKGTFLEARISATG
jgi:hypothetical protein